MKLLISINSLVAIIFAWLIVGYSLDYKFKGGWFFSYCWPIALGYLLILVVAVISAMCGCHVARVSGSGNVVIQNREYAEECCFGTTFFPGGNKCMPCRTEGK